MKFSFARVLSIASFFLLLHTPMLAQTTGVDPLAPTHDTKSAAAPYHSESTLRLKA